MSQPPSYVRTTHEVENQPEPLGDHDAFAGDVALREAAQRTGGAWLVDKLAAYGPRVGDSTLREQARLANRFTPELRSHDRVGRRIDEVEFHPAYHSLMRVAMQHEVHSLTWSSGHAAGHAAHAALLYLHAQLEAGTCCPLTMTHAALPALRADAGLLAEWKPRMLSTGYDPRALPAAQKTSATLGMAMTEKQGGSDVRANSTRAEPTDSKGSGQTYLLSGHKWFCSAPMSDAFLTLAQTQAGLSCFLVPRFLPDGSRNRFLIQRLKDKLGNRSNASSEIEYDRTWAQLLGEEGRGVATILQMVEQTRVDCAAGSAGLMRQALVEAIHHARQRSAFGRRLIALPLMQQVLADLAIEAEGALLLSLRVAHSYDLRDDPREQLFARIATPLAKYWVTRRAPGFAFEAMECLGGAGYVEESALPRIYREMPVNSIWEGSGNVQCLDVLRVLRRQPEALEALLGELQQAASEPLIRARLASVERCVRGDGPLEARARKLAEDLSLCLIASLLLQHAPSHVAEAYCAARLGSDAGHSYGLLPSHVDAPAIIDRALPA